MVPKFHDIRLAYLTSPAYLDDLVCRINTAGAPVITCQMLSSWEAWRWASGPKDHLSAQHTLWVDCRAGFSAHQGGRDPLCPSGCTLEVLTVYQLYNPNPMVKLRKVNTVQYHYLTIGHIQILSIIPIMSFLATFPFGSESSPRTCIISSCHDS